MFIGAASGTRAGEGPATRRFLLGVVAALVLGVAFWAAGRRTIEDLPLIFVQAPRQIVPEGHVEQVKLVRRRLPKGSTIFYLMDQPEAWQLGLWQRSLYPDYAVLPVVGRDELRTNRARIEFVISAGTPPLDPGFEWQVPLPGYPNNVPAVLGKIRPQ
jgi:hypothetical protein